MSLATGFAASVANGLTFHGGHGDRGSSFGGHFNPAVTLALCLKGNSLKIDTTSLIPKLFFAFPFSDCFERIYQDVACFWATLRCYTSRPRLSFGLLAIPCFAGGSSTCFACCRKTMLTRQLPHGWAMDGTSMHTDSFADSSIDRDHFCACLGTCKAKQYVCAYFGGFFLYRMYSHRLATTHGCSQCLALLRFTLDRGEELVDGLDYRFGKFDRRSLGCPLGYACFFGQHHQRRLWSQRWDRLGSGWNLRKLNDWLVPTSSAAPKKGLNLQFHSSHQKLGWSSQLKTCFFCAALQHVALLFRFCFLLHWLLSHSFPSTNQTSDRYTRKSYRNGTAY